jgi:hypothetical protein
MLKKVLLLFVFSNMLYVFAQQKDYTPLHYEFHLSFNYSYIADQNTENRLGFGASFYKRYVLTDNVDVFTGLEYNRYTFYKIILLRDNHSFFTKTTYGLSNLSIPLVIRKYYGSFFIEPGVFAEINLGGSRKGNYFGTKAQSPDPALYKYFLNTGNFGFNYGPQLGSGFQLPFKNRNLILKADYKHGLIKELKYSDYFRLQYFRFMAGINF